MISNIDLNAMTRKLMGCAVEDHAQAQKAEQRHLKDRISIRRRAEMSNETERQKLRKQLEETRAQMERLEAELERTEEWEPEGGDWIVTKSGKVSKYMHSDEISKFGTMRKTERQAEHASDLMRIHNRALAYVEEHAPDWPKNGEAATYAEYEENQAHCVFRAPVSRLWCVRKEAQLAVGEVVGPRSVMQQLADDLNSGHVKL